jgi:2-polyprenyl-6-methoxyphenol hydroxylase-like FAD-dependent oxidoreductase
VLGSREHAVVIGASFAGMFCARVLADHFASVTIIERDSLPETPEPRKGVAQSNQTHALPEKGIRVIDELFPGFWDEMTAQGAVSFNAGTDLLWFQRGGWKLSVPGPTAYGQSRPLLELHVRRRLLKDRPHVSVRQGDVKGFIHDASQQRITGVYLRGEDGKDIPLQASCVVDASGRGTRTPRWLEELGYGHPPEEHVRMDICYATRVVEPPPRARDWKGMIVFGTAPHEKRLGYIFPIEGGRWMLTLAGYHGDHPSADDEGFNAFARSVHHPAYFEAIKDAKPVSPAYLYKMPSNQRYYYERMERFPEGLIVAGDALCCFNPIFGQGITTAVLGAVALRETLGEQKADPSKKFSQSYLQRTTGFNDVSWMLATGEDLRYPETQGKRTLGMKLVHWYTSQLTELCSVDKEVASTLLLVQHMKEPAGKLWSPRIALKALSWGLGLRGNRVMVKDPPTRTLPIP